MTLHFNLPPPPPEPTKYLTSTVVVDCLVKLAHFV